MFFDDNIGYSSAHIADVRNARTGESVAFEDAKNTYLMRAEPVNAVLDPKYFVRCARAVDCAWNPTWHAARHAVWPSVRNLFCG